MFFSLLKPSTGKCVYENIAVYDWNLHIIYTKGKITRIAFSKNYAFTFPRIEHLIANYHQTYDLWQGDHNWLQTLPLQDCDHFKNNSVIISIVGQICTIKKIEQIIKKYIEKEWP